MSCLGNTIARSLALVSIGTIAAFAHWAYQPLRLTLGTANNGQAVSPAPGPGGESDPGGNTAGNPGGVQGDPGGAADPGGNSPEGAAPFDPQTLGSRIKTGDTYRLWLTGEVIFVDARPQKDYVQGHIPGAFLVPPESIEDGRLGRMMEDGGVFPDMRVVVYCEGGTCDASQLVALTLQDMGFTMLHIDADGFPAWESAGYEVETGPDMVLGDVP